jgi:antibiotic biosynthesis monooxygenase (ABM) superfamily enzyme
MAIHVAITRKVKPGKEDEFKEALRRFLGESFLHGGVQGAAMITLLPDADNQEIGILRTFADEAERDAFYSSRLFKDWEAYASTLTEEPNYRQLSGLEAWFRSPVPLPAGKWSLQRCAAFIPRAFCYHIL